MYINSDGMTLKMDGKSIRLNNDGIDFTVGYVEEKTECEIEVNNKNKKLFKCVKCKMPRIRIYNMPKEIIVQGDTSVFRYTGNDKVILHKAEEDEFNLEYAFLYAYFVHNNRMSKGEASRFLKSLTEDVNE